MDHGAILKPNRKRNFSHRESLFVRDSRILQELIFKINEENQELIFPAVSSHMGAWQDKAVLL